ncbi:branched-chain amino acid transport system II carrier protein [Photobacterium aquae]|uniref:branched-chain amino acid transport system II carrier protein n=1 Tax=Photobacterium aquae TaxID=1195763 RepID=UPI000A05245B|nr:branched-chain amino acid transport system II carrier protein [Photobacterium aquae]
MNKHNTLAIGLMTFALFLGAGNIIFPPFLGLQAGTHFLPAMLGFLITAVGLPALTLIVLGRLSNSQQLTAALPAPVATLFWVLLFTAIGPAFGMPRAVTVAYEMGIAPFVGSNMLLPFSIAFVSLTLILAFQRGKLVDYIGKIMTPLLVTLLAILAIAAFTHPISPMAAPTGDYQHQALTQGLIQGYMTMDAIAAVGFGWVIIKTIRDKGVASRQGLFRSTIQVTMIYAVLMSACYLAMGYVGATSSGVAGGAENGGTILSLYVAKLFGIYGQYLLAGIIVMACLTTTVGLTNACAEYYQQTFNAPFSFTSFIVCLLTGIIANFGLNQILAVSLPAILILCPVAIALVITALFIKAERNMRSVYLATVTVTLFFGMLDTLHILDKLPESLNTLFSQYLPLYGAHASWFLPCLASLFFARLYRHKLPCVALKKNKAEYSTTEQ